MEPVSSLRFFTGLSNLHVFLACDMPSWPNHISQMDHMGPRQLFKLSAWYNHSGNLRWYQATREVQAEVWSSPSKKQMRCIRIETPGTAARSQPTTERERWSAQPASQL